MNNTLNERMTRKEAAKYLGVAPKTLAQWACHRTHQLPYIKVGRQVQYFRKDLDRFLEANIVA